MMKQLRSSPGGVLVTLAALVLSTSAWAGAKVRGSVAITFSGGNGTASGRLGSARNSSDTVQYIGCTASTSGTPGTGTTISYMSCSARNAQNVTVSCGSSNPDFIETLRTLNSDSYVSFSWDGTGNCTGLTVATYSQYEPKEP
ncbi:hypothetical protein [Hyalangium gracile]|uniref:hypothetical protein n=1 Tax=Hyalangium gracile TaxID=394092 RepID=UPI001CCD0722|nr:hypothetical protein [Hyalangium gracile]